MSQPGKKTIAINMLPCISRRKDNQIMKFGQFLKYNMRNIFVETSHTKCCGKTSPRPISKISKFSILWIKVLQYTVYFYCTLS